MRTYLTNCILTFTNRPQAFLDLHVPLEAGEEACRVFFQGIADALHPTPLLPSSGVGGWACVANADAVRSTELAKVSMCANAPEGKAWAELYPDALLALSWFTACQGKLYFR